VQLSRALARVAEWRINFAVQDLACTAWVFVMTGQSDAQLFMVFQRVAERHVGDFKAQGLASTA